MKKVLEWERKREWKRGICFLDLGNDPPPPPAPDPRIGEAATMNAEIAREMLGLTREQWEHQKGLQREYKPRIDRLLDLQERVGREAADRASEQWGIYQQDFRPVERRIVSEAMEWDSPEALERASQEAGARVARSAAAARAAAERALQARGINPASGAYAGMMSDLAMNEAAMRAGAENAAAEARRMQGMQLRHGVAQFGRGMPQTGIAAGGLGLQGAAGASGTAQTQMMAPGAMAAQTLPWYTGAAGVGTAGGQLLLGVHQANLGAWNAQMQAEAAEQAGLGSFIGSLGMLGARKLLGLSAREAKERNKPVSGERILAGLEMIPVEAWSYKGERQPRVGPYAEDVQGMFGDAAAPGGVGLDLVTMNGIALAAIKELAKRVKRLEGNKEPELSVAVLKRAPKRDTEVV